jgi:hypothetical protein
MGDKSVDKRRVADNLINLSKTLENRHYTMQAKNITGTTFKFNDSTGLPYNNFDERVSYLDEKSEIALKEMVEQSERPPPVEDVEKFLVKAAKQQIKTFHVPHGKITRSYIIKKKKSLKFYDTLADVTTLARDQAEQDIRSAMAFAALCATLCPITPPPLLINVDATQFNVGGQDGGKRKVVVSKNAPRRNLKVLPDPKNKRQLAYYIKYYLLIDAEGTRGDPIYILANELMGVEEIDVYEVRELASSTSRHDTAYVVFMHSRVPNKAFYRWFNKDVLIPFVEDQRSKLKEDAPNKVALFTLDGENNQIEVIEELQEKERVEKAHIIVAKPPYSTTQITQPCDVGNAFRGSKQKLKELKDADFSNHNALPALTEVFQKHVAKYSTTSTDSKGKKKVKKMSPEHVKAAKFGLLKIQKAAREAIKQETIFQSFAKTGMYPLDVPKIFEQFKRADITEADKANFNENLPNMKRVLATTGEITDLNFDEMKFREGRDCDGRKLNQRRVVVLTDPKITQKALNVYFPPPPVAVQPQVATQKRGRRKAASTNQPSVVESTPNPAAVALEGPNISEEAPNVSIPAPVVAVMSQVAPKKRGRPPASTNQPNVDESPSKPAKRPRK